VTSPFALIPAGVLVGLSYGTVGVGGAVLGTPVLALLGVPGVIAVATPLAPTIPAAIGAGLSYRKRGEMDHRVAVLALVGATPSVVIGAYLSDWVSGAALLIASGVVLALVGLRLVAVRERTTIARAAVASKLTILARSVAAGLFTGLLANGGTFVFIPLLVLVLNHGYRRAVGTSLVIAAVLSIPAVITHAALGHVDWTVAFYFGVGLIPGAFTGSQLAPRIRESVLQAVLGWGLVAFAIAFVVVRLAGSN
jgi:uncharacterized membrane protein YfcA